MSSWMFKLRGKLSPQQSTVLSIIGVVIFLLIWLLLTTPFLSVDPTDYIDPANPDQTVEIPDGRPIVSKGILPHPWDVARSKIELFHENDLIKNTFRSIGLNLAGYVKALMWSLPIGFLLGLIPLFRGTFQRHIDAIRFLPLTAVTGLFIVWFGIQTNMKVNFLAFGIMIYLLPIIVQRIDEVNDVYLKTVYTLGANNWQTIKSVYIPSVMSRLSDDIRILTAISWTYIIVAEMIASDGGLGDLIFKSRRMGQVDKIFALLIIIIAIGVLQDRIFKYLDRKFFPHKHVKYNKYKKEIVEEASIWDNISDFGMKAFIWIMLGLYILIFINEFTGFLTEAKFMDYFFGQTQWVIHLIMWSIIFYQSKCFWDRSQEKKLAIAINESK